jgi:two-component system, chemotaxis family, sensor kinase CheA
VADEDITQEFLVESHENLDRLERELVAFEQVGASPESIAAIFRTVHTIKGTAGFFGFERLQHLTHVAENLLVKVRDGQLELEPAIVSALLAVVDAVRLMLSAIAAEGADFAGDNSGLIATLEALQRNAAPEEPEPVAVAVPAAAAVAAPAPVPAPVATPAPVAPAPVAAHAPAPAAHAEASETSVRIDVGLLDKLMDLAGELVLARNQLLQFATTRADAAFTQSTQRLDLITSELQDNVMKTRMQPIGGIWNKLPRVVRDLAAELHKQVRIELEGKETGLDRSIIEAIKDPLTHIVRNAVDHGIERPDVRKAAGKPTEGTLRLRASHQGGHVMIEITDDGAGIDPERVRSKALERGLITADRASRMTEAEAIDLVFAPGFSTAEKVSNISGRGVGMDVVKTNIERIGGVVSIESGRGTGTTMRIKIPLTLAIIPALIINANNERYAVPQVGVLELVRIDSNNGRGIEWIHGAPVYRLRGELLPLVYLDEVLGGDGRSGKTVVVLQNEGRPFGMIVDGVHDTEEIVVKPAGKRMRDLPTYAGATILGDGRIAMILDVRGIAARAGIGHAKRDKAVAVQAETVAPHDRYLVVELAPNRRAAVALDRVVRLEEFAASTIEFAAGVEVVQYRDQMLPLIRLAESLGACPEPTDTLHVVVYTAGSRQVGVVVVGIVDIFEQRIELTNTVQRFGVRGSAVIDGKVTDVADIEAITAQLGLIQAEAA